MSLTLDLTKNLISRSSVTPNDEGCQLYMADFLKPLGFNIEHMPFEDVVNLWARRGTQHPVIAFAGHTDVVPTGDLERWEFPPFEPTEKDGMLYGRGAADMKGSIGAFMAATKRFVEDQPNHKGSIAYLITADEEGDAYNGTVKVVETLEARNEKMDYALVGEPSSTNKVGDVVKNGRRGSMLGYFKILGKQGHVAYPHLANNPVHSFATAMLELVNTHWDEGNDFFPATSFQIANLNCGTGATNVIPGEMDIQCSFRFCTESTPEGLQARVAEIFEKHGVEAEVRWEVKGLPFLTAKGPLVESASKAIKTVCGYETELSTAGGTSDGRFIAPTGAQVLELGPCNATIHQINEHVSISDLDSLEEIYYHTLVNLLT